MPAPGAGPPWILGHRGAPHDAPEHTHAGFATALALGLDGWAYDLRACASGELVLHADATLERTTDGAGVLLERTWREIAELDAGASFHARFRGERPMLLEEALQLRRADGGTPLHLALLHDAAAAARVAALVRELAPRASFRVASDEREVVLAARDAGLEACAVVGALDERVLESAHADRPAGLCAPVDEWTGPHGAHVWPVERWALAVDAPEELLAAVRARLFALTTREPRRALAARALAHLAPEDAGAWPVELPRLDVHPAGGAAARGEWWGSWRVAARVRNPFPFRVRAAAAFVVRRGAFDVEGLPVAFDLAPGAALDLPFALTGGAWRPGGDPLLLVRYAWRAGPGRPAGELDVDAPLVRSRGAAADALPQRLTLLRDGPRDEPASLVLRRRGAFVTVALEAPGGLVDPRVVVRLGREVRRGARGVRLRLPADFDERPDGLPFTCGLVAWRDGERVWRRWAGGLSDEPDPGEPGRLHPLGRG